MATETDNQPVPENLIVFGAGASFGSDTDKIQVPALGAELFCALARYSPNVWGKIDAQLHQLFESDFERGMKTLFDSFPNCVMPLQRVMAAYFFQFQPGPNNLYRLLACRIQKANWKGGVATFNYERLLEISLCCAGLQPIFGYPKSRIQIEICLPHGCCHLFQNAMRGGAKGMTGPPLAIQHEGMPEAVSDPNEFCKRITGDALPPAMSYFIAEKNTTACVNFITGQRERFADLVRSARKIAVVGLKVRTHDNHIWDPLANTKAKLVYCAGPTATGEFEEWCKQTNRSGDIILKSYFADCFDIISSELGLA